MVQAVKQFENGMSSYAICRELGISRWRHDYNYKRPHEALGNMTPIEYKQKLLNKNTNFDVNLLTV